MFKMKKISLVALGAATLFMAPAVVHADQTIDTRDANTTATVEIDGAPTDIGTLSLDSAPVLDFGNVDTGKVDGPTFSQGSLASEDGLTVTNTTDINNWKVKVSMATPFLNEEGDKLAAAELHFNKERMNVISNGDGDPSVSSGVQIDEKNKTYILSGRLNHNTKTATGTHELRFNDNAVSLVGPVDTPSGVYTATLNWDLEQAE